MYVIHNVSINIILLFNIQNVNLKAGRRLLFLECQSSLFIMVLCYFFGLVLFCCFFGYIISPSDPIKYCVIITIL